MNVSCRFLRYTLLASHTITLELHQLPSLILRMASALTASLFKTYKNSSTVGIRNNKSEKQNVERNYVEHSTKAPKASLKMFTSRVIVLTAYLFMFYLTMLAPTDDRASYVKMISE
jgi:hypothetical protein